MILYEKCSLYFNYFFARNAPMNGIRIFFLRKIRYVQIGRDCHIGPSITLTPLGGDIVENKYKRSEKFLCLGDRVGVGPNVTFLCSSHPDFSEKLTKIYPGKFEPIIVEDDVWIGSGAILLPGVRVHHTSIVGAGAVVTRDVPSFTVVAGVPAQPIKTLPGGE